MVAVLVVGDAVVVVVAVLAVDDAVVVVVAVAAIRDAVAVIIGVCGILLAVVVIVTVVLVIVSVDPDPAGLIVASGLRTPPRRCERASDRGKGADGKECHQCQNEQVLAYRGEELH